MDFGRNKGCGVGASDDNFPYDGAADVRKLRLGNQKHGFDPVADDMVELGNGFFIIEIGGIAQAAQEVAGADTLTVMRRQVLKGIDADLRVFGKNLPQPFHALFQREQVFFGGIDTHCDNNFVEEGQGAPYQIHMADSDGVKRTGEYRDFHIESG